jgi:hypothetical protein
MNKILPFIFIVSFWGLYLVGTKYPETGDAIAIVAVICFIMYILYIVKSYLLKRIMNNK